MYYRGLLDAPTVWNILPVDSLLLAISCPGYLLFDHYLWLLHLWVCLFVRIERYKNAKIKITPYVFLFCSFWYLAKLTIFFSSPSSLQSKSPLPLTYCLISLSNHLSQPLFPVLFYISFVCTLSSPFHYCLLHSPYPPLYLQPITPW